ncbi:MAG: crossover junction endodeoxyribonuclease RuvC [Spirochaetales bacterium]|nr:crossover junction endodeoxyribonuclease RuvC [Spirochaetales bacterium]
MSRVLGIDPGLANAGWGIIDVEGNRLTFVAYGSISTDSKIPAPLRLKEIYDKLSVVIEKYSPAEAGMETLYFAKNVKTALPVAEARGVLSLCLVQSGLILSEYTPLQIKQAVVGNGHADKNQVQQMVKLILGLDKIPKPDHAADALAAAICHVHMRVLHV